MKAPIGVVYLTDDGIKDVIGPYQQPNPQPLRYRLRVALHLLRALFSV